MSNRRGWLLVSKWDLTKWKSAIFLVMILVPFLVSFDHTLLLFLQLNQVSGRRSDYWGRPTSFVRNCLLILSGLGTESVRVRYPEGSKKFRVTTSLSGMFKAGGFLFCTAASFVVRRFRRWFAASASILLQNHPPVLFVVLRLLVK
jgi:hypothetical protein